jgi:hypothetical protein
LSIAPVLIPGTFVGGDQVVLHFRRRVGRAIVLVPARSRILLRRRSNPGLARAPLDRIRSSRATRVRRRSQTSLIAIVVARNPTAMQISPASDLARLRADNLVLRARRRGDARHLAARHRIAAGSMLQEADAPGEPR